MFTIYASLLYVSCYIGGEQIMSRVLLLSEELVSVVLVYVM